MMEQGNLWREERIEKDNCVGTEGEKTKYSESVLIRFENTRFIPKRVNRSKQRLDAGTLWQMSQLNGPEEDRVQNTTRCHPWITMARNKN